MRPGKLAIAMVALLSLAAAARAHEVRPAYLELAQTGQETYDVLWKVPARGDNLRLGIHVRLPEGAVRTSEPRGYFAAGAYVERWSVRHPGGLNGQPIHFDGLVATTTDVLARIERLDGTTQVARVTPSDPTLVLEAGLSGWGVARTYLVLGTEHILFGIDHLLFVLALVMLVKGWLRLIETITAFTVAHSITLAAATLGWINVPGPPVEAVIALSIVFVAAEIVRGRRGRESLAARSPWVIAFAFGLLHGLGFAGALREIGLPEGAIPIALLLFNVGVEFGQILFVGAMLCLIALGRSFRLKPLYFGEWVPPYAIGGIAMFWVIQRVASFGGI